ncbi:MAG: mechanosensitive ion channel family protein [Bacteroidota bacterium]
MDVQKDNQLAPKINVSTPRQHRFWLGTYLLIALGSLALYFLSGEKSFGLSGNYQSFFHRLALACFVVFIVLIVTKSLERLIKKRSHTRQVSYNIIRLVRFTSVLVAIFITVTFLFAKWYTAAVSLGLVSLILGFALQTPISSLIGWFYIIIRTPYRIGDRIQVGTFKGDVVEISYLDTTLWEFHGEYLSNDVPSGRLIRFPNTLVLQSEVFNYSWKKFPYIWNEIPFHIAYQSDFDYVEAIIREVAKKEFGDNMAEDIRWFKEQVKDTPVDELNIKEYPFIVFRTNPNTWVEVSVTYLVAPKKASVVRSRLIKSIITALLKEPGRVMFPNSNAR